jgi:hypothetical protein
LHIAGAVDHADRAGIWRVDLAGGIDGEYPDWILPDGIRLAVAATVSLVVSMATTVPESPLATWSRLRAESTSMLTRAALGVPTAKLLNTSSAASARPWKRWHGVIESTEQRRSFA